MDTSQYLDIFLDESKEHLQNLSDQIMELEQNPENMDTINEIFRAAHSLKGMAGTMGYKRMQTLTHDMENVFSEVRNGTFKVQPGMIDVLFRSLDALEEYVNNIQQTTEEGTNDNQDLIDALNSILKNNGEVKLTNNSEPVADKKTADTPPVAEKSNAKSERWSEIKIGDTEKMLIEKAHNENLKVFGITVYIEEACVLKAARAFLVFKALEKLGETIVSVPTAQDIEDEKFELTFSLIFITSSQREEVVAAVMSVSEIEQVFCDEYVIEQTEPEKPVEEVKPVEEKTVEEIKEEAPKAVVSKAAALTPASASAGTKPAAKSSAKPVVNRTVRVDIEKLDNLMNLVSELIIAKNSLISATAADGKSENGSVNEQIEYLESVTTNLHESVMKVRMVPIESVVNRFPRMIRDLSKKLNKKMELHMTGEDTELDRTVIDEIGDPLQHLLRNSADHGLEDNEERIALGKEEVGNIYLDAYQDGNNVNIEVRDDGAGINVEKVRNKAIEKGTITAEQAENMSDKEIIDLLFRPSFSTAEKITDVSGRGVGLDVVKTKIEGLGGNIECKSVIGEGSSFIIRLPLTLAIIQALMVELGPEKYAIPLGSIETIEDVLVSDIRYVQTKEVINLRGTVIPLIRLDQILDIEAGSKEVESLTVVIVKKGNKLAGLVVDNLIGQQEIVIKSIGSYINCSKMIGGATVLGDGEIALILEVNALV